MVRRVVVMMMVLAACSGGTDTTDVSGLTLPLPSPPDTLLPPPADTQPPDVTEGLPPDAMFGGDLCTALVDADLAFLGRVRDVAALSADSCEWQVGTTAVQVQLASPAQFAQPGTADQEIAPVDGVGLDAIGVDLGGEYRVYVQVENGYFSVTAGSRIAAERLAAAAAERTLPG